MRRFLIQRTGSILLTYFVFVTLLFVLFRLTPGDPTSMYVTQGMTAEQQEAIIEAYGLNEPYHIQYRDFLVQLITGEPHRFGESYHYNVPVWDVIATRIWNTLALMIPALITAYTFGIIFGAYIGSMRDTAREKIGLLVGLTARSSPEFWIGIVLLMVFSLQLGLFPTGGMRSVGTGIPESFAERYLTTDFIWHLFLPYLTGTIFFMAQPILLMRSSIVDVINKDFIEIKEAEGLSESTIIYRHASRNAILPMITQLGIVFGVAVGGAVVIETLFSWPGMGRAMVDAVNFNDYPLAMGAFFILGSSVILMNFIADIVYVWADPRVEH